MSEVIGIESDPLREPLSDERLGELLSGVGNHEGKALLLIQMGLQRVDDPMFKRRELHNLIAQLPGAEDAYVGNENNQLDWCSGSLEKVGLVAKSKVTDVIRFGLTEEGHELGLPFAAMMLQLSDRYKVPLQNLFGATRSKAQLRSPQTRLLILEELLTNPTSQVTMEDLEKATGSNKVVPAQLRTLAVMKLINYDYLDNSNEPVYQRTDQDYLHTVGRPAVWTAEVINFFDEYDGPTTLDEIVSHCLQKVSSLDTKLTDEDAKYRVVRGAVYHLVRKGILSKDKGWKRNAPLGITLTDEQRSMWLDVMNSLELFRSQDPKFLAELRQSTKDFSANASQVSGALNRAAEASTNMQNGSEKDPATLVLSVLGEAPLSVLGIMEKVAVKHGRSLSQWGVRLALKSLTDAVETHEGKTKTFSKAAST